MRSSLGTSHLLPCNGTHHCHLLPDYCFGLLTVSLIQLLSLHGLAAATAVLVNISQALPNPGMLFCITQGKSQGPQQPTEPITFWLPAPSRSSSLPFTHCPGPPCSFPTCWGASALAVPSAGNSLLLANAQIPVKS